MEDCLVAARAVHYASTMSIAGVFAFLCLVVDEEVRPRLAPHLLPIAWVSLGLAVSSGIAWLVVVSAQMSGETVAATLTRDVIGTVLTETRFGQVWIWRFVLAVTLTLLLLSPKRWRRRGWRWCGLVLAALLLASLAWAGHGAATPGTLGDLHLAADLLHLLAAGAWVGTLVPLALLLAETRSRGDPDAPAAVRRAVLRFSRLAATSVVILFGAGLVNTWFLAGSVPALIGTGYGHLLLAKIAIFLTMVVFGAVNLLRMTPRLTAAVGDRHRIGRAALGHLARNALIEFALGICALGIVAVLGILPPGRHTEPGWPLPFRFELATLHPAAVDALAIFTALAAFFAIGAVATAAAGRYRAMILAWAGAALCGAIGLVIVRPAIAPAYPTTFFTPAEPYAAPSVQKGARLYAENCALCHGAGGRGDGPAAAAMAIRPADLVAPRLATHTPGDLFWWVSHGKGNGAMPGFAGMLSAAERWDVINFVRARAAGVLLHGAGPDLAPAAAPVLPDFAFDSAGGQQTLTELEKSGPVLVVLFGPQPPASRVAQLAAGRRRLAGAGLQVIAIAPGAPAIAGPGTHPAFPLVAVSPAVAATLELFRAPADGDETDLLLDRAGNVRARWAASGAAAIPDIATLVAAAIRVAQFPAAAERHAGH
ncbi:MAG TPA: copper homeostasis membrane protein CopD [Stellaceae bacterium]|nr:copper homeostasis membrane protein CopD [Stellaceae bacterium]